MKRIATLGSCYVDINTDNFPLGKDSVQLEQELVGGDYELVAGGSAPNFCRVVTKIGTLRPVFVGVVGDDKMGELLKRLLTNDGTEAYLHERSGVNTGIGFNMTGQDGEHLMFAVGTANAHMDSQILPVLERAIENVEYLMIGGAFKLKNLYSEFGNIVQLAHERGVKIVVDHGRVPAGTTDEHRDAVCNLVRKSDIYFPSRDEFMDVWRVASIGEGLDRLAAEAPHLTVIVKNGSESVEYHGPNDSGKIRPPHVESVGNVTGAGDTFNAATLSALADGKLLRDSIEYGCNIAAQKVSKK
jgi:ribokinase